MLRTHAALLALIPAFALGSLSCTGAVPTEEEETVMEDEAAVLAADRDMYGTFRATITQPGDMSLLVLMTDGTYHRQIRMPCSTTGPCYPAEDDGSFALWSRDGRGYMTLASDTGGAVKYELVLMGDWLRLRPLGQRAFQSLTRTVDASWCGEVRDCHLQNLSPGDCAGVWSCGSSLCNYACWADPPIAWPGALPEDPDPTGR